MPNEGDTFIARGFEKWNTITQKAEKIGFGLGAGGVIAGAALSPLVFIIPFSVILAAGAGGLYVADKATEGMGNKVLEGFRLRQPRK